MSGLLSLTKSYDIRQAIRGLQMSIVSRLVSTWGKRCGQSLVPSPIDPNRRFGVYSRQDAPFQISKLPTKTVTERWVTTSSP